MSSAEAQVVYNQSSFSEPMEAQEGFARQFDLSQPEQAMSSYQRYAWDKRLPTFTSSNMVPESCISTPSNSSKWHQRLLDDDLNETLICNRYHQKTAATPLARLHHDATKDG